MCNCKCNRRGNPAKLNLEIQSKSIKYLVNFKTVIWGQQKKKRWNLKDVQLTLSSSFLPRQRCLRENSRPSEINFSEMGFCEEWPLRLTKPVLTNRNQLSRQHSQNTHSSHLSVCRDRTLLRQINICVSFILARHFSLLLDAFRISYKLNCTQMLSNELWRSAFIRENVRASYFMSGCPFKNS